MLLFSVVPANRARNDNILENLVEYERFVEEIEAELKFFKVLIQNAKMGKAKEGNKAGETSKAGESSKSGELGKSGLSGELGELGELKPKRSRGRPKKTKMIKPPSSSLITSPPLVPLSSYHDGGEEDGKRPFDRPFDRFNKKAPAGKKHRTRKTILDETSSFDELTFE